MKRPKIEDYNVYHSSIYANYVEDLEKYCDWLEELLKIAQCPNNCDDGSIAHGSNETGWEQEQCQFCYERKQSLK